MSDYTDPVRTLQLLDDLQTLGLTDRIFSRLHHFGRAETISRHCRYCEQVQAKGGRFRRGNNALVQQRLELLADMARARSSEAHPFHLLDGLVSDVLLKLPHDRHAGTSRPHAAPSDPEQVNGEARSALRPGLKRPFAPEAASESNSALACAFQRAARVERSILYGTSPDRQMPLHLQDDARVPFLGFVGPRYRPGGLAVLAINPGGGGDAYRERTAQDADLIPLIQGFVGASPSELTYRFAQMSESYIRHVRTWNLMRILRQVLDACSSELEDIAYVNVFPYRTAGDRRPAVRALRKSWDLILVPLLDSLAPSRTVALGKKAGEIAMRLYRGPATLHVVPRTIGDSRIAPEAEAVLYELRALTRL